MMAAVGARPAVTARGEVTEDGPDQRRGSVGVARAREIDLAGPAHAVKLREGTPGVGERRAPLERRRELAAPLDVLRLAVVRLDALAERRQPGDARSVEHPCSTLRLRHGLAPRAAFGQRPDGERLVADVHLEQLAARSVDPIQIGVDEAAHERLTEPESRVDRQRGAPPAHGIGGEQDARRFGLHHPLHHHCELHRTVPVAAARSIQHRPIGEQRHPAAPHRIEQRVATAHVEKGVLLPGEARARQIFGGGAGAHRIGCPGIERTPRREHGVAHGLGQRRTRKGRAHRLCRAASGVGVFRVQPVERVEQRRRVSRAGELWFSHRLRQVTGAPHDRSLLCRLGPAPAQLLQEAPCQRPRPKPALTRGRVRPKLCP
jgi:hypothetical protein